MFNRFNMFFILSISVSIFNQLVCDEYRLLNQAFWGKKPNQQKIPQTKPCFFFLIIYWMGLISDVRLNPKLCCKSKNGLSKINFGSCEFFVCIAGWCGWDNYFLGPLDVGCEWMYANLLTPWQMRPWRNINMSWVSPSSQLSCSL